MAACILLIDDDPELLAALARPIRSAGYLVITARDGQAGLAQVEQQRPDLILCDVMMPGLNGFQTTRKLREKTDNRSIPVLLMSGKTDPADHFWAEDAGAFALLSKPLDTRTLVKTIDQALAGADSG